MNVFDWLSHMGIPEVDNFDIVEVKFKGGRKEYYRNVDFLALNTGDPVVVDVPSGRQSKRHGKVGRSSKPGNPYAL